MCHNLIRSGIRIIVVVVVDDDGDGDDAVDGDDSDVQRDQSAV